MRTLMPSEVAGAAEGETLVVGGRVRAADASSFVVADAFGSVRAAPADPRAVDGALVLVRGRKEASGLAAAAILWASAPAPGASLSETHRLSDRGVGAVLRARATAIEHVRAWFSREGFLEVETPAIVVSPGLDVHLDAVGVQTDPAPRWLVTSPEYQMKRLLVGGIHRCFQIARCFRRGELGPRHNPEFTMLEWYRAFAGADEIMRDTEAIVRVVAEAIAGRPIATVEGREIDLGTPFERLEVGRAFERHAGISADAAIALASSDEEAFFRLLVERVEPALAVYDHGVFLVRWPAPMASLARLCADDPRVAERFELYVGGVELCNGFGELTDPREQRERLLRDQARRAAEGKPVYPIDERFLAALEEGMPPSGGNALGLDRLVAICAGRAAIADVMAFPEDLL